MEESLVCELDLEIETITNSLSILNENIKCDFEDYILKKDNLCENRSIIKDSLNLINSFTVPEQNANNRIQTYVCNLQNDLKTVSNRLEASIESYSFIQNLIKVDETLQKVKENVELDLYSASEHLVKAKCLLDESAKCGRNLDFFKVKNEEYYSLFTDVSSRSLEKWNNLVHFKSEELGNKIAMSVLSVSSDVDLLKSVYQTLEKLKVPYKENFCETFLTNFITPILKCNGKVTIEHGNFVKFILEYSIKPSKSTLSDVVDVLVKLFEFVNANFDFSSDPQNNFIKCIGSHVADSFLDLFLSEHLSKRIPLKRIHIDEYNDALVELRKLLAVLTAKGFVSDSHTFIKEYCCDAKTVFENKVGSRYKEIADSLMRQDLHDVVSMNAVSLDCSMPELRQTVATSEESERDYWNNLITLFNNDSRKRSFLECQISKSISELVSLLHKCLEEASQTNSNLYISLHNTAHQIVYEYIKSPEIHRKLLDIIPQQSALVFTNTLYLIVKLVHFDKEFNTGNLFGELIGQLQTMAFRELNKQVRAQEDIIVLSLQKCGLQNLSELEVFPKAAEKAVRQCLRQTVLLQTVWNNVLPQDVYCIVIGRLVNKFIEELINFILTASDIREDIANNLVELISLITEKAPQVFTESREVHRHVKSWMKLKEIGLVLGGSLADIRERWAGGTGPLAHELEASQVRSLIVALFQSSEIRHKTLATIR